VSARHRVSFNVPVKVEVVNVTNRREVMLERPPFCTDGNAWKSAVDRVRDMKRNGQLKGEPFLVATEIYRQLGGNFV
jgi:hypothetical protein